ncbi:MAG: LysR family transcriptional regulator [Kangiellaceae bacterium]
MNWDDLRYFLSVARGGSISAAGRELGVKHTTVARRIQALETDMDARLFDRTPTGYVMTQTAENLLDKVSAIEDKVKLIDRQASHSDSALAGPLKLTVAFELANRILLPKLDSFYQVYPRIELQLMMTKGLVDLARLDADLALRMTPSPPESLIGRELTKINHGLYASECLLKQCTKRLPTILFTSELSPPPWMKKHFRDSPVAYRIDDVGSMAVAAAQGHGVVKLPCFIGDTQPGLLRLDYELEKSKWGIWLLNHVDLRSTARVRACKEFLQQLVADSKFLFTGDNSRYYQS